MIKTMHVCHRWRQKFGQALHGISLAWRTERSFRVHLVAAITVVALAALSRVSLVEWAILAVCMGLVFTSEAINTSLETLIRHISPERAPQVGHALDIAAGAVLVATLTAVVVGSMILGPRCWVFFFGSST